MVGLGKDLFLLVRRFMSVFNSGNFSADISLNIAPYSFSIFRDYFVYGLDISIISPRFLIILFTFLIFLSLW